MLYRSAQVGLIASCLISCSVGTETAADHVNSEAISPNTIRTYVNTSADTSTDPGFVRDELAAIETAVREWTRLGLKEMIDQQKPYRAELVAGVWEVSGTAPKNWIGGLAHARISQKDGRVLSAWHDK